MARLIFVSVSRTTKSRIMSSTEQIRIRKARNADLASIVEMVKEVVPLLHASGNYQWDDEYPTESDFRKDVATDVLWVAYDIAESKLAGVAAITTDQPEEYGDVGLDVTQVAIVPHRLAVSPSYRGRGIAQGLMQKAEEEARSQGISLLRVDTNVVNLPMQHIFTKLGYQYKGDMTFKFKPETYGKMRFCCFEKILL